MSLIDPYGQPRTLSLGEQLLRWHIDPWLLCLLLAISSLGLMILYSASSESADTVISQAERLGLGIAVMIGVAQIPPEAFRAAAAWFYGFSLLLLIVVLILGDHAKGAQRWLDLKVMRFQPSELMKLAMPIAVSAFIHSRRLPPGSKHGADHAGHHHGPNRPDRDRNRIWVPPRWYLSPHLCPVFRRPVVALDFCRLHQRMRDRTADVAQAA